MVTPAPPRIVSLFWGISGVNNGCGMIGVRGLGEARREQCEAPAAAERRKKDYDFPSFLRSSCSRRCLLLSSLTRFPDKSTLFRRQK